MAVEAKATPKCTSRRSLGHRPLCVPTLLHVCTKHVNSRFIFRSRGFANQLDLSVATTLPFSAVWSFPQCPSDESCARTHTPTCHASSCRHRVALCLHKKGRGAVSLRSPSPSGISTARIISALRGTRRPALHPRASTVHRRELAQHHECGARHSSVPQAWPSSRRR